jgi:microcystin-dependent protein
LTRGSYLTGSNYNGSVARTWNVDANTANVASTVVARDSSGIVRATEFIGNGTVPIGGIIMWSGSIIEAIELEPNWAICDGRTVNGKLTPNLTDRFVVAAGGSYAVGSTGGANTVTLTINQMPTHNHSGSTTDGGAHNHDVTYSDKEFILGVGADADNLASSNSVYVNKISGGDHNHNLNITSQGGNQAHENRPPYYALAFIMRTA